MQSRSMVRRFIVTGALAITCAPALLAQGSTFVGRVTADSTRTPLAGAEVTINQPLSQRTDARGEFRFINLTAGEYLVIIRMPGYEPRVDTIEVADAGEVRREYLLARIRTTLPEVPVTTTLLERRLAPFYARRQLGPGRFLDSSEFANSRGIRTGDRLRRLPGVTVFRGRFSEAFISSGRSPAGAGGGCRSNIWLDGLNQGTDFNVNSLDPSIIVAVEWYAGQASIPAQFNIPFRAGQSYCGVMVIWTR